MTRPPIWMRSDAPRGTGRPAAWDRARIVAAAVAVADRDGLPAVTMRRVAADLGTGAASLYRHLATRDDLLDLMVDEVLAGYEPPPATGDVTGDVVADLVARLALLRARPWLVDAIDARPTLGPQGVRMIELSLARLADHPAAGPTKLEAVTVLAGMLHTQAHHEHAGRALAPDQATAALEFLQRTAHDGEHPHLAAAMAGASPDDESPDERFARVLGLVLEGLLDGGEPRTYR